MQNNTSCKGFYDPEIKSVTTIVYQIKDNCYLQWELQHGLLMTTEAKESLKTTIHKIQWQNIIISLS